MDNRKHIAILGSTGSIGTQTLDVISEYPDKLYPSLLTANRNVDLLIEQALKFKPRRVVIASEDCYEKLKSALAGTGIAVECGSKAIADAVTAEDIDIVVTAMVGYSGLELLFSLHIILNYWMNTSAMMVYLLPEIEMALQ